MKRFTGHPPYTEEMSDVEKRTYQFLDNLGIVYETFTHETAFSMEECAVIEQRIGVPICKNLFLCNRQQTQFYLLMLPGDKIFKTKYLSKELGCARLSFVGEEYMMELLGIRPGAVSPMGLINNIQKNVLLVIDRDLLNTAYFGCHPCVNTSTIKLRYTDLIEKIVPATHHNYRIISLQTE